MKIHQILFFCFISALCGGHSGLVGAKLSIYAGPEGGSGSVSCYLTKSGSRKFFCKEECKAENILIKTDGLRAQSGRYSTEYTDHSSGKGRLSVTITHLIKSDSGRYRCGLGGDLVPDTFRDFEVRVVDAATLDVSSRFSRADVEGEDITYGCLGTVYGEQKFLCRNECTKEEDILIETNENRAQNGRYIIEYREGSIFGLYVTITRATKSDSGWYSCGYGRASSPDSYYTNPVLVIEASLPSASTPATTTQSVSSTSGSFTPSSVSPENTDQLTDYLLPLVVCVVVFVVVVVALVAAVLLLLYERKTNRNSDDMNMDDMNMERVAFENRPPVSTCEDPVYQSLDPATRDLDQTY